jgi:hypothetical protein
MHQVWDGRNFPNVDKKIEGYSFGALGKSRRFNVAFLLEISINYWWGGLDDSGEFFLYFLLSF